MVDENKHVDLASELNKLKPKGKEPNSTKVLDSWIAHIENSLDTDKAGRLSWLVASTLVTAKLQQVIDDTKTSRFLLKGGSLLQHRFGDVARATKDVDGMIRGDIEDFIVGMDHVFEEPWGPINFEHGEIEIINVPFKIIKPRRFDVTLKLKGKTWRRITVEISPEEGSAAEVPEYFNAPSLEGLGLPTPERLAGLALSYQIAQKVHAATDPHDPPEFVNERARDAVDILLLSELALVSGEPTEAAILSAIKDIFESRAGEGQASGRPVRFWPARFSAYGHWHSDFRIAAESAVIEISLEDAVEQLNLWLDTLNG